MIAKDVSALNLSSLEQEYSRTLWEIKHIKKSIVDTLTIPVVLDSKNDTDNFVWNIQEQIKSLGTQITESDLSKELLKQNEYIKVLTKELEARRAELFNNLDLSLIPLDKLSTIEAFLSGYQTSEHREKTTKQINLTNIVKYSMHTSIEDIELSIRAVNCLRAANIETVWDLIKVYKEEWEDMIAFRNFWKKSLKEVQEFLRENKLIDSL